MRRRASRPSKRELTAEVAASPEHVRMAAVALLARRDFASTELLEKLRDAGYDREVVTVAIDELVAGRVLDDARYAENYVTYHADRGQGPVRIATDLKALGLPAELIQAAIDAGPDWRARA